jgi:8-oxo-dGTP pyrophosphatase MutT (NUDIX family)
MPDLEWKTLDSRYVFQDEWITVRADTCEMPDGKVIEPFYILEYLPWVNVVALTAEQQIVLVRQYRPGVRQTTLELPGGSSNPDDPSMLHAIRRELREETGYGGGEFIELGALLPNPASQNNTVHGFLATNVERIAELQPDDSEFLEVVLLPLDEVIELARIGGLSHALHVATLFLALSHLGRVA